MRALRRSFALLMMPLYSGCHGVMSTMDPASVEGARLDWLARVLIAASALVFVVVVGLMLVAAARRHAQTTPIDLTPRNERLIVCGGAVIPGVILTVLFLLSLGAMRRYPTRVTQNPITFQVTGRQWWWEITYVADSARAFRTANELHVPVGTPVRITLVSADVIHSFWVPQLHGKIDLIPGDTNEIRFLATRPGMYRGQCAEYCGLQHAHMALVVVAEDSLQWVQWAAEQSRSAGSPVDTSLERGAALIANGPCAACHTIRGTAAAGTVGPDLTHVGSRQTLAAGALPNNLATMEAWITSAQQFKPGTLMPSMSQFTGDQLRAMAMYLRSLQ
jgi:cytochrome c oxidase subunit 2